MSEENKTAISFLAWSSERGPLPPRKADEEYSDYFRRLLTEWSFRAKEAEKVHATWRRRLELSGIREVDCRQRIFVVLKELMESAFLKNDYIDTGMPEEDCKRALEELEELGFGKLCQVEGADWKFALLTRHLRKQGDPRVIVDEQMAGFYIDEMREIITDEAAEAFFRFATLTRLAYQEMTQLKSHRKSEKSKVNDNLTPEQKAVRAFVAKIVSLAEMAYDEWNGKRIVPAVHKAEVEIIIEKDSLVRHMQRLQKEEFDVLSEKCYPEDSTSNSKLCLFVSQLQREGYFGQLPNKQLAKLLAPIVKLAESTVTNYLSK